MITEFICLDLELSTAAPPSPQAIEAELGKRGDPLRWAITAVQNGRARVEAIILHNEDAPKEPRP